MAFQPLSWVRTAAENAVPQLALLFHFCFERLGHMPKTALPVLDKPLRGRLGNVAQQLLQRERCQVLEGSVL